jgi:hypothetical protein
MSDDDLVIHRPPPKPEDVMELQQKMLPVFMGYHPATQGAVLASLTALFLAGHMVHGSRTKTDKVREQLLVEHVRMVRQMIPDAERAVFETMQQNQLARANPAQRIN